MKIRKKMSEEKYVDSLLIGEREKIIMFLSMISIDLCMIIHYIVEENVFVVIVCMLLLQKKFKA